MSEYNAGTPQISDEELARILAEQEAEQQVFEDNAAAMQQLKEEQAMKPEPMGAPEAAPGSIESDTPETPTGNLVEYNGKMYPAEQIETSTNIFGQEVQFLNKDIARQESREGDGVGQNLEYLGQDLAEADKQVEKRLSAPGVGLSDFAVDAVNLIPGVELPKLTKYEDEVSQFAREGSSFILPMLIGGGILSNAVKANRAVQTTKALNNPFVKFLGESALDAGVGVVVDYTNALSSEGDNLAGSAKKFLQDKWPQAAGMIPDDLATIDGDGPDARRKKSILEGFGLGFASYLVSGIGALTRGRSLRVKGKIPEPNYGRIVGDSKQSEEVISSMRDMPSDEVAGEYFVLQMTQKQGKSVEEATSMWKALNPENKKFWFESTAANDPDFVVNTLIAKQQEALDELGVYNFSKSQNLDEPLLGVHDVYGYRESGVMTTDALGIIQTSADLSRILRNIDSVDGSMGTFVSEGAIKYGISPAADANVQGDIVTGLTRQLKETGPYSYIAADGTKISYNQIVDDGLTLAGEYLGESVADLAQRFGPLISEINGLGTNVLNNAGYKSAMNLLSDTMKSFIDPDFQRAQGYIAGSFARQISDLSQGVRLMGETDALQRGQEQVLDRIQYLMMLTGQTRKAKRGANLALDIANEAVDSVKSGKQFQSVADRAEGLKTGIDGEFNKLRNEVNNTIESLRFINETRPKALEEFVLAYEMTGGKINTIQRLNDVVAESTKGFFNKGIVDFKPELESVVNKNMWAGIYNSMLSAVGTVIKAGTGSTQNLLMEPISHMGGALFTRDAATLREGFAAYSNVLDTLNKGLGYSREIWRKSASDPFVLSPRDFQYESPTWQMDIMQARADRMAAEGDFGGQIFMTQLDNWEAFNASPWTRLGQRGMGVFDGFVQSVMGNWTARTRAYQELTNFGARDMKPEQFRELSDKIYNKMFDKNGRMTDEAVKFKSGELNFNLDSNSSRALSTVVKQFPILKPFLLFQKTMLTALGYTATYTPVGAFNKRFLDFWNDPKTMSVDRAKDLVAKQGFYSENPQEIMAEYAKQRAIIKFRSAAGATFVSSAVGLYVNDRITGYGAPNKQTAKSERSLGRPDLSIKGPDGKWYSYQGLGPLTDWMALTVTVLENGLDGGLISQGVNSTRMTNPDEHLKALQFVISSSLTDKSTLAALEPLYDMLENPAAIPKWLGSFIPSATVPNASLMSEFSRLMYPALRSVENELGPQIMNRTPLKGTLPIEYDWFDGTPIKEPENFFQRLANTYLPFKTSKEISPEKQFLLDIGYNALPTIDNRKYTKAQQSEIFKIMGTSGEFKDAVKRIMKSRSAQDFRKRFKEEQEISASKPNTPYPDLGSLENLHPMLDAQLKQALRNAEAKLTERDEINQRTYNDTVIKKLRQQQRSQQRITNFIDYNNP